MQYYLNLVFRNFSSILILALVTLGILFIINLNRISQEKRLNKELYECIGCKDEVLAEFKKIRHEYNNMLQTITCYIEGEDWHGLELYKSTLLVNTHILNKNNLTQLTKIKDKKVLCMVYELFMMARDMGITLALTIYNDILDINSDNTRVYNILQDYLYSAYEFASKEAIVISLKINANDMGLRFCFENSFSIKPEILTLQSTKSKSKNIYFNINLKDDHLIQEILITYINAT